MASAHTCPVLSVSASVHIFKIGFQNTAQSPLAEHNHVVKTLPPDGADQSFCVRVLPRRVRSREHFLDAQQIGGLGTQFSIASVSIAEQVPWCFFPWERPQQLLRGPLSGGMSRQH
jgi:hypothetical protein